MPKFTSTRTPSAATRIRGSTSQHSHYISEDGGASETEAGDADESLAKGIELIDLDGDDVLDQIDLTGDDFDQRYHTPNLNYDLTNHDSIQSARTRFGVLIGLGDCVECTHEDSEAFLRIVKITRKHGDVYMHGDLLQRTGDVDKKFASVGGQLPLHSLMPRTKNELCAILRVASATTTSLGQALVTRRISEVGVVRKVIFTNKKHQDLNGQSLNEFFLNEEWKQKQEQGTLFCRRKYIEEMDVRKKQIASFQIRCIDQAECDPNRGEEVFGLPAEQIFDDFSPSTNSTSCSKSTKHPKRKRQEVIEISSSDDEPNSAFSYGYGGPSGKKKKKSARTYTETVELVDENGNKEVLTYKVAEHHTKSSRASIRNSYVYADLCAGAGGTSTGASMAGLKLKFLLDFDPDSCRTLELNFGGAAILQMDISAFSQDDTHGATGGDHIDVMHISFPCQGHSAANTGINEELDHVRIATAYGTLESILKKCKPRCLTLEQVPGILFKKDGQHFRAQVCALTQAGYSLRWKTVNFAQHGNSQARKRVIVIAACPGHILPPFPTPTHGAGLKPFVTVGDVLAEVPKLHANDLMAHYRIRDPHKYLPWNSNIPLRCCITGDGGANWHPSGTRTFSFQEKSQLQGFPATHKYHASRKDSLGRQIGNAVPPVFAKALFEAIIPCLEEMDEKARRWRLKRERQRAYDEDHPIVLD